MTKKKFIEKLGKIQDKYLEIMDSLNDIIQEKGMIKENWTRDNLSCQYARCSEFNSELGRILIEVDNEKQEMEMFGFKSPYKFDEEKSE